MNAPAAFPYSAGIAPMMWVFVALGAIELAVVHFLLSFWSPIAALILSAVTLLSLVWMVALIRSFRRLPVLVADQGVTMRVGTLRCIEAPRARLAGVRQSFPSQALREPGVVNLALIAYPNIILDLGSPLALRNRPVRAIAHRLDEPAAFARAVERLLPKPAADEEAA